MSLMSKVDALKAKATQDGANELDLMRAALVESQERYNQQAAKITLMLQKYDKRIEALEAAVEASNRQKAINIQSAMNTASEAVLSNLKENIDKYKLEVDKATADLKTATKKKEKNETLEMIQFFGGAIAILAAAFYIALYLYGRWFDTIGKLDAINNGIYQLLNK